VETEDSSDTDRKQERAVTNEDSCQLGCMTGFRG